MTQNITMPAASSGGRRFKNDIILTASVLIVAVLVFFISGLTAKSGETVKIEKDGELYAEYSLKENRTVRLEDGDGFNLLVIEDGKVYIREASCPDKLCVNQGSAEKNGETIVCLPNKTVVTVYSAAEKETDF